MRFRHTVDHATNSLYTAKFHNFYPRGLIDLKGLKKYLGYTCFFRLSIYSSKNQFLFRKTYLLLRKKQCYKFMGKFFIFLIELHYFYSKKLIEVNIVVLNEKNEFGYKWNNNSDLITATKSFIFFYLTNINCNLSDGLIHF